MRSPLPALAVSAALCLSGGSAVLANAYDAQEAACRDISVSAEARIAACSVLLDDFAYTDLSDYAVTHLSRAKAYHEIRQNAEALADLETVLEYDPFAFDAYMLRGDVLLALGEYFRAIADFTVAIGLDPLNGAPYAARGTALYAHKEYPEAQTDLENALGFDADNERAMTTLAWILAAAPDPTQRDGTRALSLTTALGSAEEDAPASLQLVGAAARAESGDIEGALASYKAMLEATPSLSSRFSGYLSAAGFLEANANAPDSAQLNAALRSCLEAGCRIGAPLPRP